MLTRKTAVALVWACVVSVLAASPLLAAPPNKNMEIYVNLTGRSTQLGSGDYNGVINFTRHYADGTSEAFVMPDGYNLRITRVSTRIEAGSTNGNKFVTWRVLVNGTTMDRGNPFLDGNGKGGSTNEYTTGYLVGAPPTIKLCEYDSETGISAFIAAQMIGVLEPK